MEKKHSDPQTLSIQLAQVGDTVLGVPEEDVFAIVSWRAPSPLPFAPASVLGVVSVQGRMFTVIDTASLLAVRSGTHQSILALRGGEQLALAINATGEQLQVAPNLVQPVTEGSSVISGIIQREAGNVHLLALEKIFAATLQGRARRRRHL